jgi:hypothetical protein
MKDLSWKYLSVMFLPDFCIVGLRELKDSRVER